MKYTRFILAAALAAAAGMMYAEQPKVVAHRGYWTAPGSAQNSIRSLVKADSIGCYGSELDVWITYDSVLVVDHDGWINHLNVQGTHSSVYTKQKLANGETVPTLEEYLQAAVPLKTKLVLEVKPQDDNRLEAAGIKKIVAMVDKYGLNDRVDYITFSKNGFKNIIKAAPKGTSVQYLTGDYTPEEIKFLKGTGVDYHINVLRTQHPDWIKKCHDLGLTVNIWTVDKPEDMQWCIDNGADFITTNYPERLQELLKASEQAKATKVKGKKAKKNKKK